MAQEAFEGKGIAEALADAGLTLSCGSRGLVLSDGDMELVANFGNMLPRIAPGRLSKELLVRAAKVKDAGEHPLLVDATAGLGEDSFLLAAAGFDVMAFEANPVIAALLADACMRALEDPELAAVAARMHVVECDSVQALEEIKASPAVIYLDPMFPERRKSAAVKKKFQLIHHLEGYSGDEEGLLSAAMAVHPKKTVIKRPLKGPYLGDVKPSYSLKGKAVRYDVLVGV